MKGRDWRRLHKWRIAAVFLLALLVLFVAVAREGDLAEAQRLNGQVLQYHASGRYQQAIPLAQRALAIREKALGPEHPDTAAALNNLVELYRATGAYAKAEPLSQRALAIYEKARGPEHPDTATETSPLPLGENPLLRSGLALAGANARRSGESDDGILTAAEAAQLDLRGTQLVVLSACETGLGQVQQGEGVYGLRRALVLAGAQAQLVSLWKVADDQTQALMVDYYQRLLNGEGRSAALREAQKAMIANPATQHPYYWAAFVPIGNWTPLAANR
jgi:tetratricopeptide (TPR) repeat protein